MSDLDMNWIKSQLQTAKVRKIVGDSVIKMLQHWEELDVPEEFKKQVIDVFSSLSLGHAIVEVKKNENWFPAQPGQITIGDEVRVKADAYDGELGRLHNGRRGKVVGLRYGDVVVKTTDQKEPVLEGAHYSPHQLEKLLLT